MKTIIRKIGNSQGVLIPKPLLAQVGLEGEVEMRIEGDALVLRKPRRNLREGLAEASKTLTEAGEDKPIWPEFANEADAKLKW